MVGTLVSAIIYPFNKFTRFHYDTIKANLMGSIGEI